MVVDPVLQVALEVARTEAEGPGTRYGVWVQGCPMRCPGCCNPEMLPFQPATPRRASEIVAAALAAGVEGVSFLGGEPFAQAEGLAAVARGVRAEGLTVMAFSGYTLEEIQGLEPPASALLAEIDLLVDGRYVAERRTTTRRWIGSENQRLHFLSKAYAADDRRFTEANTVEIRLRDGEVVLNGWPAMGARTTLLERRKPSPEPLDASDAQALEAVDALVGPGRWEPLEEPLQASHRVTLLAAVARRLARGSLRWLVTGGGYRARTVLRGAPDADSALRRVRGRVWDAELAEGLDLRFTRASERLWRGLLLQVPRLRRHDLGEKEARRLTRLWIAAGTTDIGDWLLYAAAWPRLGRLRFAGEAGEREELMERRLCDGSPLLRLLRLRNGHPFDPLLRPPAVRLVECALDRVTDAWRETLSRLPEARLEEVVNCLGAWLDAVCSAGRADLAAPALRALPALQRPQVSEAPTVAALTVRRTRWAELFEVGERLEALRETLASARYGDDRYEEAQLYLAEHEAHFAEHASRLAGVARSLRGVVG